jgi:hypothetical protein
MVPFLKNHHAVRAFSERQQSGLTIKKEQVYRIIKTKESGTTPGTYLKNQD